MFRFRPGRRHYEADAALVKAQENLAIERTRTSEVKAMLDSAGGLPDDRLIARIVGLLYPTNLLRSF
jgi:hypothetical protein